MVCENNEETQLNRQTWLGNLIWCIVFVIHRYGDIDLFFIITSISPHNAFKFDSTLATFGNKEAIYKVVIISLTFIVFLLNLLLRSTSPLLSLLVSYSLVSSSSSSNLTFLLRELSISYFPFSVLYLGVDKGVPIVIPSSSSKLLLNDSSCSLAVPTAISASH